MSGLMLRLAALLLLPLLLGGVTGCSDGNAEPEETAAPQERTVLVVLETVEPRTMLDILTLPGEAEALHDVRLSAERAGRVEWVGFTEGETVKKDELLAKIDLNALAAALERAEASKELAEAAALRRRQLFAGQVLSKEELEQADTELIRAMSNLREAQVNYEQGKVHSPISGVVEHRFVDPGEYVNQGDPVMDLVDIATLRFHVNVPEMDIRFIKPGDMARVTVDAYPEEHWDGKVDFVASRADASTKTFRVRVVVDNADRRIRPGMAARVRFLRRQILAAVTAPLFSLVDKGGERVLYVEQDGRAVARTVELGVIQNDRIQILKGLELGERLIVRGQNQVEEGMAVVTQ